MKAVVNQLNEDCGGGDPDAPALPIFEAVAYMLRIQPMSEMQKRIMIDKSVRENPCEAPTKINTVQHISMAANAAKQATEQMMPKNPPRGCSSDVAQAACIFSMRRDKTIT